MSFNLRKTVTEMRKRGGMEGEETKKRRQLIFKAFHYTTLYTRWSGSDTESPYCSQPHSNLHKHTAPTSLHGYQSCLLQRLNSKKGGGSGGRERIEGE